MAPTRRRRAPAAPAVSESRLRQISAAFDQAVSGVVPPPVAKPAKRKRANVLSDDEEDSDGDLEMVAAVAQPGSASTSAAEAEGGGGFVSDAGGFLLDEDVVMGGEFLPSGEGEGEPELAAGGFLPEPGEAPFRLDDSEPTAGGFLLDDTDTTAGAGGFILDDSEPAGGFLADPSFDFNAPFPPPLPPFSFDDLSVPDAEPAARIRLKSIPDALAALHLPSDSHDLLALFADAASDDEEGVPSVSRARFVEACSALLGEDSEEAEKEDSDEEESDAYVEDVSHRRTAPRRATRANPLPLVAPLDKGKGRAIEIDDDDDDDEPLVISSSDEESAADSDDELAPAAKGKGKGKATKGKGKAVKVAAPRKLTEEELKEAEDSYELFFEGSAKAGQRQRTIGLGELKNVAALLNEKLSDEDLMEMLEYAGRDGGVVDLPAFTRILAEAL